MATMTVAVISIDEAAKEFKVGRRTLERLIAKGELPKYQRAGDRRTFVQRQEIVTALGYRRVEPDR